MSENLQHYRKSYDKGALRKNQALSDPLDQFTKWFDELKALDVDFEINAMHCITLDEAGYPVSRVVLLKGYDQDGFQFFTNYNSQKAQNIEKHPLVSLSFFWPNMERQVHIRGKAQKMSAAASDAYFSVRPRGSQIGAHVSEHSTVIESREFLETRLRALEELYANKEIPRPAHWGGYLIQPHEYEFWQGRPNRLHDRLRYTQVDGQWKIERLAP